MNSAPTDNIVLIVFLKNLTRDTTVSTEENTVKYKQVLTAASLSKRANSSLSSFTSSWALQAEDSWVKPTMSANRILQWKCRCCNVKLRKLQKKSLPIQRSWFCEPDLTFSWRYMYIVLNCCCWTSVWLAWFFMPCSISSAICLGRMDSNNSSYMERKSGKVWVLPCSVMTERTNSSLCENGVTEALQGSSIDPVNWWDVFWSAGSICLLPEPPTEKAIWEFYLRFLPLPRSVSPSPSTYPLHSTSPSFPPPPKQLRSLCSTNCHSQEHGRNETQVEELNE